jgi:hypothetical protein
MDQRGHEHGIVGRPRADRQASDVLRREHLPDLGRQVGELWNHRDDLGLMQQVGAEIYAGAAPGERAEDPPRS